MHKLGYSAESLQIEKKAIRKIIRSTDKINIFEAARSKRKS